MNLYIMNSLVLLLAAAALLCKCNSAASIDRKVQRLSDDINIDHAMEKNSIVETKKSGKKKFLNFQQRPPLSIEHRGGLLQLACEAMGRPAPSIQWLRNDLPILEHDQDSSEVLDVSPSSMARLNSTLFVRPSETFENVYTCVAVSGALTIRSSTTVYSTDINTDLSERYKLLPLEPKIAVSYISYIDTIENRAILPCLVKGHPRPTVHWIDNNKALIKNNERFTVLRSGELVIKSLQWSDLGDFICVASNIFGTTQETTFVYPAVIKRVRKLKAERTAGIMVT